MLTFRKFLEENEAAREGFMLTIGYYANEYPDIDPEDALHGGEVERYKYRVPRRMQKVNRLQRIVGGRRKDMRYTQKQVGSLEEGLKEFQNILFSIVRDRQQAQIMRADSGNSIDHIALVNYHGTVLDRTVIAYWDRPAVGMGQIKFNPQFEYLSDKLITPSANIQKSHDMYKKWQQQQYDYENAPTKG
jgi:hypothetical protein